MVLPVDGAEGLCVWPFQLQYSVALDFDMNLLIRFL